MPNQVNFFSSWSTHEVRKSTHTHTHGRGRRFARPAVITRIWTIEGSKSNWSRHESIFFRLISSPFVPDMLFVVFFWNFWIFSFELMKKNSKISEKNSKSKNEKLRLFSIIFELFEFLSNFCRIFFVIFRIFTWKTLTSPSTTCSETEGSALKQSGIFWISGIFKGSSVDLTTGGAGFGVFWKKNRLN